MENKERVLAYGLATEIIEQDMQDVSGGSSNLTHYGTRYYTNKKAGGDVEHDDAWD
ncbi:hypothetical protein [Legionella hackeliae]|uniref:Uncharacterized protein n=1 Tax=Legionella hackeliae TaxID=449 RepID=A0A0A8UXH0_LEGHA|nr:hypothetical protein [Legionella hackeliae]KTD12792.1 hypothetical protein Lhac_1663 [Legionella hackeliae]CEK12216.1 conserved protein of unknown function [Legionella hackeliae]STX49002.1 Uncharacterised protein [Legionella hackeliae]